MIDKLPIIAIVLFATAILTTACQRPTNQQPQSEASNTTTSQLPYFPTQKVRATEQMQALLVGKLELINGCLRVGENLLIFPYGFTLRNTNDTLTVYDAAGQRLAAVGDTIRLGGGQLGTGENNTPLEFENERCNGPYWIIGDVLRN